MGAEVDLDQRVARLAEPLRTLPLEADRLPVLDIGGSLTASLRPSGNSALTLAAEATSSIET